MQSTAAQRQQNSPMVAEVRRELLSWFDGHKRDLPWRRTKDPYAVWLSEIMLQQTRVAAAVAYYERFLSRFPNYHALAAAKESEVLTYWAGLGYYMRARNLHRAAKEMAAANCFPSDYASIRALRGIGDYTASAIASIAFGLRHAAVDGNVLRVLSRLYGDKTDIARPSGQKHFSRIANDLLDPLRPGDFNEAMMELGATVCLPRNPQCLLCPLRHECGAYNTGAQADLPVKNVRQRRVFAHRTLFWIESSGSVLAWRRGADASLMAGFWELPEREQLPTALSGAVVAKFRHSITFHSYTFEVVRNDPPQQVGTCEWLPIDMLAKLPISTIFRKAVRVIENQR